METVAETAATDRRAVFEWMLVEIFGHRTHWGRGIEVERFGAKMLRIDVPKIEWSIADRGESLRLSRSSRTG
jgi:hypothetical protein